MNYIPEPFVINEYLNLKQKNKTNSYFIEYCVAIGYTNTEAMGLISHVKSFLKRKQDKEE